MTTTEQRILAALAEADGGLSSYQIKRVIESVPSGPKYQTMADLYSALLQLLNDHMVARAGWANVGVNSKARKVYGITPFGRTALMGGDT